MRRQQDPSYGGYYHPSVPSETQTDERDSDPRTESFPL